eukprot:6725844-Prymnesium_polylepis.2
MIVGFGYRPLCVGAYRPSSHISARTQRAAPAAHTHPLVPCASDTPVERDAGTSRHSSPSV